MDIQYPLDSDRAMDSKLYDMTEMKMCSEATFSTGETNGERGTALF